MKTQQISQLVVSAISEGLSKEATKVLFGVTQAAGESVAHGLGALGDEILGAELNSTEVAHFVKTMLRSTIHSLTSSLPQMEASRDYNALIIGEEAANKLYEEGVRIVALVRANAERLDPKTIVKQASKPIVTLAS